jgi:hypothetical protein
LEPIEDAVIHVARARGVYRLVEHGCLRPREDASHTERADDQANASEPAGPFVEAMGMSHALAISGVLALAGGVFRHARFLAGGGFR